MRSLMSFLSKHRVPVMLTGHAHSTCLAPITFPTHTTLEARCGTTTQIDLLDAELTGRLPLGTQVSIELRRRRHVNALLVHQVVSTQRGLEWVTRNYVRTAFEFERGVRTETVLLT